MNSVTVTNQPEYHWMPTAWLQLCLAITRRQAEQAVQFSSAAYAAWMNAAMQTSVQMLESTANRAQPARDNGRRRRHDD